MNRVDVRVSDVIAALEARGYVVVKPRPDQCEEARYSRAQSIRFHIDSGASVERAIELVDNPVLPQL